MTDPPQAERIVPGGRRILRKNRCVSRLFSVTIYSAPLSHARKQSSIRIISISKTEGSATNPSCIAFNL